MRKALLSIILLLASLKGFSQCNPQFTWAPGTGNYEIVFTNTTQFTPTSTQAVVYTIPYLSWQPIYWNTPTYTYNFGAAGTYPITLRMLVMDSLTQTPICYDSVTYNVTVNNPPCYSNISTVNNGGGSYTFTANNLGGGSGLTYTWNLGDGTTATGATITHTYAYSNVYGVSLSITGNGTSCSASTSVTYTGGPYDCGLLQAGMYAGPSGMNVGYYNNSNNLPPVFNIDLQSFWDFGDGTTSTVNGGTKTYTAPGTYTITLVNQWIDSATNTVYCTDTTSQQVTVNIPVPQPGTISGMVIGGLQSYVYKVWLITYDSVTNIIDAIDSTTVAPVNGWGSNYYYFNNVPAGDYRVKAAVLSYDPDSTSFAPTYATSSLNWGSASVINNNGGSWGNTIVMVAGNTTTGPGFISGNVTQGAGKGTGAGVPNLLILLRNSSTQMERFTYTDVNGDYSFGSLPLGTYDVYPENMPQVTTPSASINIASGSTTVSGIDFEKTSTQIKPKTTGIADIPAADLFSVSPNPASNAVTLQWSKNVPASLNVRISDMTGRIIYEKAANTNAATSIRLENVPSGMYFIKVASDKAQHTQKLVIQK